VKWLIRYTDCSSSTDGRPRSSAPERLLPDELGPGPIPDL
jgi:hypothetical protein